MTQNRWKELRLLNLQYKQSIKMWKLIIGNYTLTPNLWLFIQTKLRICVYLVRVGSTMISLPSATYQS